MCEHNLVIGKNYRLYATKGVICSMCGHNWEIPEGVLAQYIGDEVLNAHTFNPVQPIICPSCQYKNGTINLPCSSGNPIDVTQEFLSLPVRTK